MRISKIRDKKDIDFGEIVKVREYKEVRIYRKI